jgi:O-acetylhomoserine/O-acetylserine sulfhydrylase-like pyridoxal-dependent enzyme
MDKNWKIETLAVQGGYEPGNGDPRIVPITQSTTFKYDDAQSVADLFDLKAPGFFYTRLPTPQWMPLNAKSPPWKKVWQLWHSQADRPPTPLL